MVHTDVQGRNSSKENLAGIRIMKLRECSQVVHESMSVAVFYNYVLSTSDIYV